MKKIKSTTFKLFNFDFLILFSVVSLMVIGIFFIYSSGINSDGISVSNEYIKQILFAATGIVILAVFAFFDYQKLKQVSPYIFLCLIIFLVLTLIWGNVIHGARSWLKIGFLGFQPSEFMKIGTLLFLSSFLESRRKQIGKLSTFLLVGGILIIPLGLIFLQPDLGTCLVYIPLFFSMIFVAGIPVLYILYIIIVGVIAIFLAVYYSWYSYITPDKNIIVRIYSDTNLVIIITSFLFFIFLVSLAGYFIFKKNRQFFYLSYFFSSIALGFIFSLLIIKGLKPYQMMRLIVFLDPQVDPLGAGWNIIQSVTAVGSGGPFGKGFLQGTQSHYRYLPQQSTDFIFSIISEEWGFLGSAIIFILFLIIIIRTLYIAYTSRDNFGTNFCGGFAGILLFHVVENVGMTTGIMPVTGIPLPFISYGGSSLWTVLIGTGIVLSIHYRRYRN